LRSNKTRIAKLEQARGARVRQYVFYPDEIAEAKAQGLPYVEAPRLLSTREWIEKYGGQPAAELSTREWMEKYGGQPAAEPSPEDLTVPSSDAAADLRQKSLNRSGASSV
jgi:hypothetical protein